MCPHQSQMHGTLAPGNTANHVCRHKHQHATQMRIAAGNTQAPSEKGKIRSDLAVHQRVPLVLPCRPRTDADSDDGGEDPAGAELARITANALMFSQTGKTLQPGAWRGCCKSPWCVMSHTQAPQRKASCSTI